MSATNGRGFWVTNHLANPILRPLLRGPLGRRLGRRLAVLRYRGRRTGRVRKLVVQYVREGDQVWSWPGQPQRKRWWRNMAEPQPVEVWLAGSRHSGVPSPRRGRPRRRGGQGAGQADGRLADLEVRHRSHARVEDRIRTGKATGLRNLPCKGYDQNRV
jgi:hypothetical protein